MADSTDIAKTIDWKPNTHSTTRSSLYSRITVISLVLLVIAGAVTIGILQPWNINNNDAKGIYTPSADTIAVRAHVSSQLVNVLRNASGQLIFPYLIPQQGLDALFDWDAVFLGIGISSRFPDASRYFAGSMLNFLSNVSLTTGEVRGLLLSNGGSSYLSHAKPVLVWGAYLAAQKNGNDFNSFRPYKDQMAALLTYWEKPPRFDANSGCSLWLDMPESGVDNLAYAPCASDSMPCWDSSKSPYSVATPDLPVFRERQATAYELFARHWAESDAKAAAQLQDLAEQAITDVVINAAKVGEVEVLSSILSKIGLTPSTTPSVDLVSTKIRSPSAVDLASQQTPATTTTTSTTTLSSLTTLSSPTTTTLSSSTLSLLTLALAARERAMALAIIASESAQYASDASALAKKVKSEVNRCLDSLWSDALVGWTARNMSSGMLLSTRTFMLAFPVWGSINRSEPSSRIASAIESVFKPDMVAADSRLIRSLSLNDPLYTNAIAVPGMSGSNWRGPAWMPPNIILAYSLAASGRRDAALLIAQAVLQTLAGDLQRTGTWHENYNTDNITSVMGDAGFLSFNALAVDLEQNLIEGVDPFELVY